MFLCVAARRSVLDSPGSFQHLQVTANALLDVTLTFSAGHRLRGHRRLCASVSGVDWTHLRKRRQQRQPPADSGLKINWGHLERVSSWSRAPQHSGVYTCLFTGNWELSGSRGSVAMRQSRAHSATAAKQQQQRVAAAAAAAEKQPADSNNKEDVQNLKEASTTTSSSTATAAGEPEPEGGPLNKTQQLKKVFKEYGAVGVSFHIGMSLMSLGMFYLLVSSGIDIAALLCKLGFSEAVVQSRMAAGTSTFVLAYAIHKLFAPVRISITLVSVPLIVRYFRKTGLFKPPTPAP